MGGFALVFHIIDGEDALGAKDVGALGLEDHGHPVAEEREIDLAARDVDADRGDALVVLVLAVRVEELGVHLEGALQVEGADVEHAVHGDLGPLATHDGRELVDRLEPRLDAHKVGLVDEVDLVEADSVRESDLLHGLVLGALGFLLVEVLLDVLCVDHGHNAVQLAKGTHFLLDEKSLRHRCRVRKPRRLDDDGVEMQPARRTPLRQLLQHLHQVLAHGAADAPVHHLDDLLRRMLLHPLFEQSVVDPHIAKLVLDHCDFLAVGRGQNVVEQRRLSAPEEARQNRHRHLLRRHRAGVRVQRRTGVQLV